MRRSVIAPPFAPRKDLGNREAQAWAAAHAAPAVAPASSSSCSVPCILVLLIAGIGRGLITLTVGSQCTIVPVYPFALLMTMRALCRSLWGCRVSLLACLLMVCQCTLFTFETGQW
jgi:hypothetical protein